METPLRVITAAVQHEVDKIKGSRFIASVRPFKEEDDLDGILLPLRKAFPEANHHCWAWRLGRNVDHFRCSDDGEPSGSAGRPILQQIESRRLTNVVVVVTRIFGGTKLGVGGLMRAYSSATAEALERCPQQDWILKQRIALRYAYEFDGIVKSEILQAGLQPVSTQYDTQIHQSLQVPEEKLSGFLQQLRDRTAGRIEVHLEGSPE